MSTVRISTPDEGITQLEKKEKPAGISFTVTQLSKHNNSKKGYWIAIDGLVYDISKSIDAFPELIPYAGTDISNQFPGLSDKLTQYLIGHLLNPEESAKVKVKCILYRITTIANELDDTLSNKKYSEYASLYIKSKTVIESIFTELALLLTDDELIQLKKSNESFHFLNDVFSATGTSAEDYYTILFNYKGLANLLKFMFEEYIDHKLNQSIFRDDLNVLAHTEKKDAFNLITKSCAQRNTRKVIIIGGSITGLALSIQLKKLGLDVAVYDKYDDPRIKYADHASASFSLFITERGLNVLDKLGLKEKLLAIAQPVNGRHYHTKEDIREDLNGPNDEKLILVKRDAILNLLVTEAQRMGVNLNFDVECKSVSIEKSCTTISAVHVHSKRAIKIKTEVVFGADGSNSMLRKVIDSKLSIPEKSTMEQHNQVYCEFLLPADEKGQSRFDQTKLHVWARDGFAFVAFPIENNAFSLSLFIDKFKPELSKLQSDPDYLVSFVKEHVPELYPFVYKIILTEPPKRWGVLNKVISTKWYDGCHLSLIGDAAHGSYPFNGQGGNCDLEDTLAIHDLIDRQLKTKKVIDWREIFCEFSKRKIDTDIMANFTLIPPAPMSHEHFKLKKLVTFELIKQGVPSFFYLMSFTTLPYSQIQSLTKDHDSLLAEIFAILCKKEGEISKDMLRSVTTQAISKKSSIVLPKDSKIHSSIHSFFSEDPACSLFQVARTKAEKKPSQVLTDTPTKTKMSHFGQG